MLLDKESLQGKNQEKEKTEVVKIKTDTEVHDPEIVMQQIKNIIEQLNQEIGQEVYKICGERKMDDDYGIGTMLIFLQYLGHNIAPLEICISAGMDGLKRGINPDMETVKILIQAATIQLKAGLSKHGELIERRGRF